jgi:hypothetical protein
MSARIVTCRGCQAVGELKDWSGQAIVFWKLGAARWQDRPTADEVRQGLRCGYCGADPERLIFDGLARRKKAEARR